MHYCVGTSGFQYPEWKPAFYPADLSTSQMLPFYAEHFQTTEINYSFRRIPSEKTLAAWDHATPAKFILSFKAPQRITHFARLKDCAETLNVFSAAISFLKAKLGPVLFQLPPNFTKDSERLLAFLAILPKPIKAAFEFRHPSWFDEEIFSALRRHNAALCLAENEDLATPPIPTADFGYLRLRREDYSPKRIKHWAKFVGEQTQWRHTFIYFKHEERALGPKFARQMIADLPRTT